jgi:hypothetical protein
MVENGRVFVVSLGSEVKHAGAKFYRGGIMTTDLVCGMKVDDKRGEFHTQFAGKIFFLFGELQKGIRSCAG